MVRFFVIRIDYRGETLRAKVVERHLSPSTFHISFQEQGNFVVPENIIMDTKKGNLELSEDSPSVSDEILLLVSAKIEEYLRHHPLSSDFRI